MTSWFADVDATRGKFNAVAEARRRLRNRCPMMLLGLKAEAVRALPRFAGEPLATATAART